MHDALDHRAALETLSRHVPASANVDRALSRVVRVSISIGMPRRTSRSSRIAPPLVGAVSLAFDRGSLRLDAPRTARVPPYLTWDDRVGAWRTEACRTSEMRRNYHRRRVSGPAVVRSWSSVRCFPSPRPMEAKARRKTAGSNRGPAITEIDSPHLCDGCHLTVDPAGSGPRACPSASIRGNQVGIDAGILWECGNRTGLLRARRGVQLSRICA